MNVVTRDHAVLVRVTETTAHQGSHLESRLESRKNRAMASLKTPLCRELGIDYPIFSVGFAESAGPELVSAVSNAGGFGVLGFSGVPEREEVLVPKTFCIPLPELNSEFFSSERLWAESGDKPGSFFANSNRASEYAATSETPATRCGWVPNGYWYPNLLSPRSAGLAARRIQPTCNRP